MYRTKVAVVGPLESGKTILSNFLSEATASSDKEYRSTQGVRILEFESDGVHSDTGKAFRVEVELWDCSGRKRFETCWPAFSKDVHGVLIVVKSEHLKQEKEVERWYSYFVKRQQLKDSQCLLIVLSKDKDRSHPVEISKSSKMAAVKCVHATREDLESIRSEFALLLTTLCDTSKEAQDKAEQEVMNQ